MRNGNECIDQYKITLDEQLNSTNLWEQRIWNSFDSKQLRKKTTRKRCGDVSLKVSRDYSILFSLMRVLMDKQWNCNTEYNDLCDTSNYQFFSQSIKCNK